ncbi:DUF6164 family protein [Simiduia agarivorans]|uniref:DUF2007 domain-containing protein n=1 Tax=Simiduia agarivorans (strain DSM 21679 / JCM 13881 / BCRC 17597 / SA1) TaxID=1117647 RepID=K4L152_SIMAS|nr:DUF6164 family protein [Simiduia agarivorans]AFU99902.1 hypothetical protein M5M_13820 [Simiduia agarivorans SA1 = DSM 21679]
MGQLLFKLNQVPEAEAQAVRELLDQAGLDWYETQAGFWGIGVAAIWLTDAGELPKAKALLAEFEAGWIERMRAQPPESFWARSARKPLPLLAALLSAAIILTIMIVPMLGAWD